MGEAKKKEISSLDELREKAKSFGKKLLDDVAGETKKPLSQLKTAGKVLEQIDAVTDAPKRAFVGAAKKSGSLKEGAEAAARQLKAGVTKGKLLDDTPEYSSILEDDMVSRGIPRKLAKSNSQVMGAILDVAGGSVGAGEAVAGAKVAKGAAKELKAFAKANSLLDPELGGIGRLSVESFDKKTMEKMRKMTEALKREGQDAGSAKSILSDEMEMETKSTDEGLGSILEGGGEKRAKALELAKAKELRDPGEVNQTLHDVIGNEDLEDGRLGELIDELHTSKLGLSRPGRSMKSVLEDLDIADKKLAKRKGQTVDNPLKGRDGKEDFGAGPVSHQGKSKIPQRLAEPKKKNPDGFAEKILEEGGGEEGALLFLDNVPLYHSDAKGMRYELKGHGKKSKVEPLPMEKQKIFKRTKEDDAANTGEIERLDSDYETFTGEPKEKESPLGDDLLDKAERMGRLSDYKAKHGREKTVTRVDEKGDETKKRVYQGQSILDEDDVADFNEAAFQDSAGIGKDGASNAQRLKLNELGYPKADSPHLTEEIAQRIIDDFDDDARFGKMREKYGDEITVNQKNYLESKGLKDLSATSKKEASDLIGGFKGHEQSIKDKIQAIHRDSQVKAKKETVNAKPAVEAKKAVGESSSAPKAEAQGPNTIASIDSRVEAIQKKKEEFGAYAKYTPASEKTAEWRALDAEEDRLLQERRNLVKEDRIRREYDEPREKFLKSVDEHVASIEKEKPAYTRMTLETYLDKHFKQNKEESYGQALKRAREELRDLKAKSKKPTK